MPIRLMIWIPMALIMTQTSESAVMYSARLIHRFSDEARAFMAPRKEASFWPAMKSLEYYQTLLSNDFQRQQMKLGPRFQLLFPSEGSEMMSSGNELGWLHYTWIDIGTPNISFLVALDAGSDLLWLPCDCIRCSLVYGASILQDRDLNEYSPASSGTSRHLMCGHQLCKLVSNCQSSSQPCPYTVQYYSENTSSSGLLLQDVLHLSSSSSQSSTSISASIIIGCGKNQSGGYLDGVAPDGVMGLGLGEVSVPSSLAKAGLIQNSFSLCFSEDGSGTILFGDRGLSAQQTTPFLPLDGKYVTYIVGVEAACIGKDSCLKETGFQALIDSGTSFTFLPDNVFEKVVEEFDRQVNATRESYDGYPWKYCYKSSAQEQLHIPSVRFMFSSNSTFTVLSPLFPVHGDQGIVGYCLAIQPAEGDIGMIGQNFMSGYRLVFDRENMKLGWSHSDCQDHSNEKKIPLAPSTNGGPPNPLPTNEQQSTTKGHAVSPAVAGRAPPNASAAAGVRSPFWILLLRLLFLLLPFVQLWRLEHETHLI